MSRRVPALSILPTIEVNSLQDYVIEIFSSIQGEGKYVGCRQVFVRFADCNLRCAYCDTDYRRNKTCSVEKYAGTMHFDEIPNPIGVDDVLENINRLMKEVPTQAVSFTGGEPLLHSMFIKKIAAEIDGAKRFLETNGTLPTKLEEVIDAIDVVSMDIKLPRLIGADFFEQHREFLKLLRRKEHYVKLVIDNEMTHDEFWSVLDLLVSAARNTPVIIQPVTPVGMIRAAKPEMILRCQATASKYLCDVRVIPQVHRLLAVL